MRNFTSAESKKKSEAELRNIIENGKPKTAMVAWKGQLSEVEIKGVLAYVVDAAKIARERTGNSRFRQISNLYGER
jgi:mono/diheme cytochrome c family protein